MVIPACNLQLGNSIGQGPLESLKFTVVLQILFIYTGEFGIVYKAQLKSTFNDTFSQTVAVKTLKGMITSLGNAWVSKWFITESARSSKLL